MFNENRFKIAERPPLKLSAKMRDLGCFKLKNFINNKLTGKFYFTYAFVSMMAFLPANT